MAQSTWSLRKTTFLFWYSIVNIDHADCPFLKRLRPLFAGCRPPMQKLIEDQFRTTQPALGETIGSQSLDGLRGLSLGFKAHASYPPPPI